MIPVDFDNFIVYAISSMESYECIYISSVQNTYQKKWRIVYYSITCTQLEVLVINYTEIADISVLSNCASLRILDIRFNDKIVDISELSKCIMLQTLYIGCSNIKNISVLSHCTSLRIKY